MVSHHTTEFDRHTVVVSHVVGGNLLDADVGGARARLEEIGGGKKSYRTSPKEFASSHFHHVPFHAVPARTFRRTLVILRHYTPT